MAKRAFEILIKRKIEKDLHRLPASIQETFRLLVEDLRDSGPIQRGWRNFSALGAGKYHCHLQYKYVACWRYQKGSNLIEVYYVGSREEAPYQGGEAPDRRARVLVGR